MTIESQSTQELIQLMYKGGSLLLHVGKDTGKNSIKLAAFIQAKLKAASENKVSGALDISKLNKDGQPITCYNIRFSDFQQIIKKAKEFGLLYSVIYDKKDPNPDKEVLMFIRMADAVKLERIMEGLQIAAVEPDVSSVKIKESKNGIISAEVDFGERKEHAKRETRNEDAELPFAETPSVEKSVTLNGTQKRKSIRTEVEAIKAQESPENESEKTISRKNRPEELGLDEQLLREFGNPNKGMDL